MKLFFDENGRLKNFDKGSEVYRGNKNVDVIESYVDFDASSYKPSVTLRRFDGFELGPYVMLPGTDSKGKKYHYYALQDYDTAVSGPMEITVRYDVYRYDEDLEEEVLFSSKAMAMVSVDVKETIIGEDDDRFSLIVNNLIQLKEDISIISKDTTHYYDSSGNEITSQVSDTSIHILEDVVEPAYIPMMAMSMETSEDTVVFEPLMDDGNISRYSGQVQVASSEGLYDDGKISNYKGGN